MDLSQKKQELSKAYVRAIAATAGYATAEPSVDDDSVDLSLRARGSNGAVRSPSLDIQLKCTARDILTSAVLNFPLPLKNYNDLRHEDYLVPRILVIVTVPDSELDWIVHSEDELLVRHCGYWFSLRGLPATENSTSVTVTIPRAQLFDVPSVIQLMNNISQGGHP